MDLRGEIVEGSSNPFSPIFIDANYKTDSLGPSQVPFSMYDIRKILDVVKS